MKQVKTIVVIPKEAVFCPWNDPPQFVKSKFYCTHPDGPTNCREYEIPKLCPLRKFDYLIKLGGKDEK